MQEDGQVLIKFKSTSSSAQNDRWNKDIPQKNLDIEFPVEESQPRENQ